MCYTPSCVAADECLQKDMTILTKLPLTQKQQDKIFGFFKAADGKIGKFTTEDTDMIFKIAKLLQPNFTCGE